MLKRLGHQTLFWLWKRNDSFQSSYTVHNVKLMALLCLTTFLYSCRDFPVDDGKDKKIIRGRAQEITWGFSDVALGTKDQVENLSNKAQIRRNYFLIQYNLYNSGILLKLCTSAMFQTCQKLSCLGSILCFLILNTTLSTNQRIALYSCHLFFFSS